MTSGSRRSDPLFFLSYGQAHLDDLGARPSPDPNEEVGRLFALLSSHVSLLLGLRTGEGVGFIDRWLVGGERWTPELLRAAGTCQVLVSLVSPHLIRSTWCGMEWELYSRRKREPRVGAVQERDSGIVPVTWLPTREDELPAAIRSIQRFTPQRLPDPRVAALYQREGLYGLLMTSQRAEFNMVVWRLAQHVVDILGALRVAPEIPAGPEALRNAFIDDVSGEEWA